MTIAATITAPVSYACNGVATAFSFPYRFLEDADLTVYLVENATGTSTPLTLTTHYTVTGAGGPSGGTVTTVSTYASGYTLVIVLEPDFTQETDLVDNDPMPAATLENALDKLTMMAQIMSTRVDRSFRLGDDDTSSASTTLPTPAASKLIGWNAAGDALENYAAADFSTATVTAFAETLLDDTDAATARATLGAASSTHGHDGTYLQEVVDDTTPQLGGDLDCQNKDLHSIATASLNGVYDNGTKSTGWTLDWNNGQHQEVTLGGDTTVSFTAPPGPGIFRIDIHQDGTGGRTLTLPTGKWAGGSAKTMDSTASAMNKLLVEYDGSGYTFDLMTGVASVTTPTI